MRLICPNCDAQYDIADDVIPEGGREVQCSNCTHTWFQTDKPKAAGSARQIMTPSPTPAPKPAPEAEAEAELESEPAPEPSASAPKSRGYDTPTRALTPAQVRKPLDSSIADILREEAGRNHELPATAAPKPPADPEADADAAVKRAEETRERISRLTEEPYEGPAKVAAAATGAVTATSDNLRSVPSMEEINASLRARAEASDTSGLNETEKNDAVQRSGFRRGFAFVLVLIALAIMPYFFPTQIVERFPQTREFMAQYMQTVNQLRGQVRDIATQVASTVQGLMPTDADVPVDAMPADPVTPADPAPATSSDG